MVEKKPYCYAPWVGLNITTGSNVDYRNQKPNTNYMYYAPCCAWQGKYYNGPIEKLYESDYWKKIIKDMEEHNIENLKDSCKECFVREKSSLESDRQHIYSRVHNTKWDKKNLTEEEWRHTNKYVPGKLNWLDYRPSNECNFKCRMCSPSNSNLIAKEENENIPMSKDNDIYKIDLSNLKVLKILGGEPTIQKEVHDFLDYVIENYNTSYFSFSYTTNMAVVNNKWLDKLKNFKKVFVEMSIDGTGNTFEYMRTNGKWNIVEKNIKKLYIFSKVNKFEDFRIKFHITIGAVLLVTIEEWLPWFIKNDHIDAEFFPLGGVAGEIGALEEKYRIPVINYLNSLNHSYAKDILSLIDAEEYHEKLFSIFKKKIIQQDKIRETNIKNLHPTLNEMFINTTESF